MAQAQALADKRWTEFQNLVKDTTGQTAQLQLLLESFDDEQLEAARHQMTASHQDAQRNARRYLRVLLDGDADAAGDLCAGVHFAQ